MPASGPGNDSGCGCLVGALIVLAIVVFIVIVGSTGDLNRCLTGCPPEPTTTQGPR